MVKKNGGPNLGPCCVCETTEGARNILMLHRKSPVAGQGWGCFTCGLSQDGAVAVVCDECLNKPLRFACAGGTERAPFDTLAGYHLHDLSKHRELHGSPAELFAALEWFKESPDEGHPLCLCSWCGKQIPGGDNEAADEGRALAVRMWNGKNEEARFHNSCFEQVLKLGVLSI